MLVTAQRANLALSLIPMLPLHCHAYGLHFEDHCTVFVNLLG